MAQYEINDRYALILFNPYERNGAEKEAKKLEDALLAIGFKQQVIKWDSVQGLPGQIHDAASDIPCTASIVLVCIMSHGRLGSLSDSTGSQLPLNYILHQLGHDISEGIPLVGCSSMLCQKRGSKPVHPCSIC